MKHLPFFLFFLATCGACAQDISPKTGDPDFPRVQIGINFSPDLCYRTLINADGNSSTDLVLDQRNKRETPKWGYSTGLNVCFHVKKSFGVEMGLQYANKGYQAKQDLIFEQPDPSLPQSTRFIYTFYGVDIPLKANFTLGEKNLRFFSSFGVLTTFFIRQTQKSTIVYADRSETLTNSTNDVFNKVYLSALLSAGIDYQINNRLNVRVEPTLRHGVSKISEGPLSAYLYSAGLNVGCYMGL